jgi:predicted metalloendopeptidase
LQGGLGMPDRDYYLDPSPRMAEIRNKYQAHIVAVLRLAGMNENKAEGIFALETKIAKTHATRTESEDIQKANNPWLPADFKHKAPGMNWGVFFRAAGLEGQPLFMVWQPGAFIGESVLVAGEPLEVWKDYLAYHAIDEWSSLLPKAFVDEQFDFYGKFLTGTPKLRERWKRAVNSCNAALGDAVGQIYVKKYFPPEAKARAEAMVANLVKAFGRRIDNLTWMSPATKAKAKEKLSTLKVGVGYPDQWRDYSGLEVSRSKALQNAIQAELYQYRQELAKLRQSVNRSEWWMTPQTVNAVNLPIQNALNFPAAILQPPYFDPLADAANNYGAIGSVIGHEISHSFDDQGCQFDASGRLANWWTPEDYSHFKAASARLVEQYNAYHPFPDLAVNGKQTLSENIADVAGLAVAHDAYRLSLGSKPAALRQGLTGDQQFFISFAQSWRTKFREQLLRQIIILDGHAPAEYRADTVRNLDAWYDAFEVKPGEALYLAPGDRIRLW